jgi:hypothetical protein
MSWISQLALRILVEAGAHVCSHWFLNQLQGHLNVQFQITINYVYMLLFSVTFNDKNQQSNWEQGLDVHCHLQFMF